jgi:hypothetical protein
VVLIGVDYFKYQGFCHTVHVDKGTTGMTELISQCDAILGLIPSEQALL